MFTRFSQSKMIFHTDLCGLGSPYRRCSGGVGGIGRLESCERTISGDRRGAGSAGSGGMASLFAANDDPLTASLYDMKGCSPRFRSPDDADALLDADWLAPLLLFITGGSGGLTGALELPGGSGGSAVASLFDECVDDVTVCLRDAADDDDGALAGARDADEDDVIVLRWFSRMRS